MGIVSLNCRGSKKKKKKKKTKIKLNKGNAGAANRKDLNEVYDCLNVEDEDDIV